MPNSACVGCHSPGSAVAPERVHWNQNEENAAKYKMNIESAAYDAATREVTVKYFLSDPTNGNAAYNLVTPDCTGTGATIACANTDQVRQPAPLPRLPEHGRPAHGRRPSSRPTTTAAAAPTSFAYKGTNDGSNHYTVQIPVPADSTASRWPPARARVVSIGQIKEPKLAGEVGRRPAAGSHARATLVNVVVQHTFKDLALSGPLMPRRAVVSNEKCNVCHGALGTTSGSNTLAEAFHSGARNTVEACVDLPRPEPDVVHRS